MQEVSGVHTSPLLHTDERKMALQARNVSGAFEKRAPGLDVNGERLFRSKGGVAQEHTARTQTPTALDGERACDYTTVPPRSVVD